MANVLPFLLFEGVDKVSFDRIGIGSGCLIFGLPSLDILLLTHFFFVNHRVGYAPTLASALPLLFCLCSFGR